MSKNSQLLKINPKKLLLNDFSAKKKDKHAFSTQVTVSLWFSLSYFRSTYIFLFLQEEISFCIEELAKD